jgi:hypothetical protein
VNARYVQCLSRRLQAARTPPALGRTAKPLGAAKMRSTVEAVSALHRYEEEHEIGAEDFTGRQVEIRVGIEKRRGVADTNIVESYRPARAV